MGDGWGTYSEQMVAARASGELIGGVWYNPYQQKRESEKERRKKLSRKKPL